MNKTRLLTSVAVFGVFSMPAMADIASNAESATCDSGTIGVSSGSTVLEALWTAQTKNCDAGTYLNSTTANCTPCPAGSFCAGGNYTYDGSNVGLTGTCPTDYTSDANATAQSECYRACTTDDIAHSTAVSGKYYYGDNNQCAATGCETGYHVKTLYDDIESINPTNSTWAWIDTDGFAAAGNTTTNTQAYYNLLDSNSWSVDFDGFGIIQGVASCNGTYGGFHATQPDGTFSTTNSGDACWCKITGLLVNNASDIKSISSDWVYSDSDFGSADVCGRNCAKGCAYMYALYNNYTYQEYKAIEGSGICTGNKYGCSGGNYFNAAQLSCQTCPEGYYCGDNPYGQNYIYDGTDKGLYNCPEGYTSEAGANQISKCYVPGILNCSDVAPYNNGHEINVVYGNSDNGFASCKTYYGDTECTIDASDACEITNIICSAGWSFAGASALPDIDITVNGTDSAYVDKNGVFVANYGPRTKDTTRDYWGFEENDTDLWGAELGDQGIVTGKAKCSDLTGDSRGMSWTGNLENFVATEDSLNAGSGEAKYCWCQPTNFITTDAQNTTFDSLPAIFAYDMSSAEACTNSCSANCAEFVRGFRSFRLAIFEYAKTTPSCSANTITIDWYNLGSLLQSNSCTYGQSDIVIPEVPERTGYDFGGWKVKTND